MDKANKNKQKAADSMEDFIRYVSSPWRIVWANFIAGVFRGLGAIIGASIVIALIIWILSMFANLPWVGEYANQVKTAVSGYVEDTNYNDEFDRLGDTLDRIEAGLKASSTVSKPATNSDN